MKNQEYVTFTLSCEEEGKNGDIVCFYVGYGTRAYALNCHHMLDKRNNALGEFLRAIKAQNQPIYVAFCSRHKTRRGAEQRKNELIARYADSVYNVIGHTVHAPIRLDLPLED